MDDSSPAADMGYDWVVDADSDSPQHGPVAWYYSRLCIGCEMLYSQKRGHQLVQHLCCAEGKGHDSLHSRGAKSLWAALKPLSSCLGSQRRHLVGHSGLKAGDRGHSSTGFGTGQDSLLIGFPQMRTESSEASLRSHQQSLQHYSVAHPTYTGQGFHNIRVSSSPQCLGFFGI